METEKKKHSRKHTALKVILIVLLVLILLAVAAVGAYYVLRERGESSLKENISSVENQMPSTDVPADTTEDEEPEDDDVRDETPVDPNLVWHNGKTYRYKEDIMTILCMGVDQLSEVFEQTEGISGESGQADTIFLLVLDPTEAKIKIIGISRDTMTPIKTFDAKGNYVGESVNHLGLAYAFGDGKETSCLYTVDAVSQLFYGLPINAYVALHMNAIADINDAVGGVPVTITENLKFIDKRFVPGATVTLKGEKALRYIRWRDETQPFSNEQRMVRQKNYVMSFIQQAMTSVKTDMTIPVKLYQSLTAQMVTNIGLDQVVYLTSQVLSYSLDESGIRMLQAKSQEGSVYDEVYVDDAALYELILEIFYSEQPMEDENIPAATGQPLEGEL